ncbi:hypothetical protein PK35_13275 [Tamlana nanhaiensis]|uniref:Uncharacterized protein n=1 Tax=Neotamlana nanhaiensis TaxID=1382798 RepID=A0A0D7VXV3_9FLAO|nr:hypothetical protein [Tamlana nanhaiensis]KJD31720.1 hypothetical protein PK35_13275 [Tamlana nanhaiensis]
MAKKHIKINEFNLKNNCPVCYSNDGLKLTFKQQLIENAFYKATTLDTLNELFCNTCNSNIYPVQWTDDLERVFEYHKRAITPKSKSFHLKKLTWLIVILTAIITVSAIGFMVLYN